MNVVPLFESPEENNLNTPNLKGSDGGGVGFFLFAEGTLHYAARSFFTVAYHFCLLRHLFATRLPR